MSKLPPLDKCNVAVLGLGYVGLPLAVEISLAKKHKLNHSLQDRYVIGFDINTSRIKELNSGFDRTNEISESILKNLSNIEFTDNCCALAKADVFIITVPTPIDKGNSPDLNPIKNATEIVAKALKERVNLSANYVPIVIYESTVYPGATEEICIPILEDHSRLTLNALDDSEYTFGVGYSPERINPGDKKNTIQTIIKVTSGSSPEIANWVDYFYQSIIAAGTFKASTIKVAEASKVIENTQRDLNIAIVNEFSLIFRRLGIDTLDVLEAAGTKWNFLKFRPGLVGGHCISVDPYYLTYKSKQSGYYPDLLLTGRRINDGMGTLIMEELILEMVKRSMETKSIKMLILGFTFKENCNDIRNTRVIDIIETAKNYNISCTTVDPYASIRETKNLYNVDILNVLPDAAQYNVILVALSHEYFKCFTIEKWKSLIFSNTIIFDLKGIVPRSLNPIRI